MTATATTSMDCVGCCSMLVALIIWNGLLMGFQCKYRDIYLAQADKVFGQRQRMNHSFPLHSKSSQGKTTNSLLLLLLLLSLLMTTSKRKKEAKADSLFMLVVILAVYHRQSDSTAYSLPLCRRLSLLFKQKKLKIKSDFILNILCQWMFLFGPTTLICPQAEAYKILFIYKTAKISF